MSAQDLPDRRTGAGYFGQGASATLYTGETLADKRNVIDNIQNLLDEIQDSTNLNGMQQRQLKNTRNKMTAMKGLISTRQLTPDSYTKFADVVEALVRRDCNRAMDICSEIQENRSLRAATRNWLPYVKTLTTLVRQM